MDYCSDWHIIDVVTSKNIKVLDLFSGLGGWSQAFIDEGLGVVTLDVDARFNPTIVADILEIDFSFIKERGPFDLVLASPPCEKFTVMQIGRNWTPPPENAPKTEDAKTALKIVQRTLDLIDYLEPRWWVIENPVGKLRKLEVMAGIPRRTITQCQYGMSYMKPTDLWGGFPPAIYLKPPCKQGAPCHERAPRGSRKGIQANLTPAERAKIPYELSKAILRDVKNSTCLITNGWANPREPLPKEYKKGS